MIVPCFCDFQNKIGILLPVSPVDRRLSFHAHGHIHGSFRMRQENCRRSPSVRFRSADSSRFRMLYSIRNPDVSDTLDPSKTLPVPHPASRKIIAENIQTPAVTFRLDCRAVLLCINAHASFPSSSSASYQSGAELPHPSAHGCFDGVLSSFPPVAFAASAGISYQSRCAPFAFGCS